MKFFSIRRVSVLALFILPAFYFLFVPSARAQFLVSVKEQAPPAAVNPLVASYVLTNIPTVQRDTVPMRFAVDNTSSLPGHKSVFLAAAFSAILPGLGEYYVGDDIWRGMIFTGVEAGLWVGMIRWNQRFNDSLNAFYAFSDKHFSTTRYANNLDSVIASVHLDSGTIVAKGNNIASINRAEIILDSFYASNSFVSDDYGHQLVNPAVDNQQYYEMISKYDQYIPGWDFVGNWSLASLMRADANAQADVANIFLYGIILNHVLSAIDAALLARDHNSPISLHGDVIQTTLPNGFMAFIPTAFIEYRF
jgi:hypothetical protein